MNVQTYMPVRLVIGRNCVRENSALIAACGSRALIVTGKHGAESCGALTAVAEALEREKIPWVQFDGIGANPRIEACLAGAEAAEAFGADLIIGIGGGSPMDAAKCIAVLAANPGMTEEELYTLKWPVHPLPVVLVGTTAGTGSEVTKVSVITRSSGMKKSFNHDTIYPVLSLGDPAYTDSLSDYQTRATAVDAVAHCAESYFNRKADLLSRSYAVSGLRLALEVFETIADAGTGALTEEQREQLYLASIYGGLAINTTGTTFPHSVGYILSERHGIAHGAACAVFLKYFYEHNRQAVPVLTGEFLDSLRVGNETREETEARFLRLLEQVRPAVKVHMSEEELTEAYPRWVNNSSIGKAFGQIPPEETDRVLRQLFGGATEQ